MVRSSIFALLVVAGGASLVACFDFAQLRLAPPDAVAHLMIDHFDGLDSFDDLPSDGRCVREMWF